MRDLCCVRRSLSRDLVSGDGQVYQVLLGLRIETPRSIVGDLVPLVSCESESVNRLNDVVEGVQVSELQALVGRFLSEIEGSQDVQLGVTLGGGI